MILKNILSYRISIVIYIQSASASPALICSHAVFSRFTLEFAGMFVWRIRILICTVTHTHFVALWCKWDRLRGRRYIYTRGLDLNLKSSPFVPSAGLLRRVSMWKEGIPPARTPLKRSLKTPLHPRFFSNSFGQEANFNFYSSSHSRVRR